MIPVKLELENFLCYRQPAPLDFSGIHVACLAGENGAGKSSLLDAMTWALWGKARARRDDELIYLGQDEMRVEFTFDLEGNRYRVLRQRQATKRGRSVLDLQIADGDGHFCAISESTIRQTQVKIDSAQISPCIRVPGIKRDDLHKKFTRLFKITGRVSLTGFGKQLCRIRWSGFIRAAG